jgi:Ala-tRNA(Pro) deacylase
MNDVSQRVSVVLDAGLMGHETINCHPLENTATTNIGREDLLKFMRACGHEPRIVMLGGASPTGP